MWLTIKRYAIATVFDCRRQVFWISKQILQLVMEDAIDDWLLRQIQWLRREDVVAQGIRWVQDVRYELLFNTFIE